MSNDPYETLGVARDADDDTIKRAYRKLARQYHPDVNPDPESQEHFKQVTNAYEVLSDPEKRRMYDLGGDPFGRAGGGGGAGFSFTDVMDAFFGGGAQSRGPRPRMRRGQDALVRMQVELAEAAFGTTKELKVDTAVLCNSCSGSGASEGSTPVTCDTCHGRGEVQYVQRSFLGEVRTLRPCGPCRGYGEIIPHHAVSAAVMGGSGQDDQSASRSRKGSTPAPGCSWLVKAKLARAVAPLVTCTSRCSSQSIRPICVKTRISVAR